jgi:putative transposase
MIQNRSLARRIADAGWSRLVELLRYKLAWSGGQLVEVAAAYSSQTCAACGAIDPESRDRERFRCTHCGYIDHADLNAAKVLKSRVESLGSAYGGSAARGHPSKQEKVVKLRVPRRSPQSPAL